ncbi:class I SAM-dependent methyltransferase [Pseudonocardia humida]|uniref:Methyltransferase domain-containing protein n=1 Tax=Pseudonocardia humida TaxID=2800819 RepID=A0ABT1A4S5_9PSEU|nr:methyltransferase domain-containing protein [Pseudonocardia humida]MCO1657839.1 methyltransferase domain-containing protein [Pseudonocardia humida]
MTTTAPTPATGATAEEFGERLFTAVLGTQLVQAAYLGDRLGFYRALAGEALTAAELAVRTGTAERYAREWLEHQAVCGVLTVDDDAAPADARRFRLPAGHAEVLTDVLSPNHVLPLARMAAGIGRHVDELAGAYRTGGGVSWADFGADARESQAAANRPLFLGALPRDYLPSVPDIDAVLRRGGRVADVGCGFGWSAIGLALAHPDVTVDGFDPDGPSIEAARRNAAEAGVGDRVRFRTTDAALAEGGYDLVAAFECIHDMPDPVSVLAAMRTMAGADGVVLVVDERVAEHFTAPGDEVEQLMYGWSITCCLPDGLAHPGSVGTGTVMRPDTLRGYARAAGFAGVDVLPIEDGFFRFYRLR